MSILVTLLTTFGPFAAKLALSILDSILKKNAADVASQQAFLDFTAAMSKGGLISVNLHDSYIDQQKKNQDAVDKILKDREAAKQAPPA